MPYSQDARTSRFYLSPRSAFAEVICRFIPPSLQIGLKNQQRVTLRTRISHLAKNSEIQAQFISLNFGKIIPILRTIASRRFRKPSFFIFPPVGDAEWVLLDKEVIALAERVNATAVADRLECFLTTLRAWAKWDFSRSKGCYLGLRRTLVCRSG